MRVIAQWLRLVMQAAASMRSASATLSIFAEKLPLDGRTPTANAGRLWLLRLGLYELTREKEQADDYVWMLDHTIQIGAVKCLLIVAIRLSAWKKAEFGPLTHQDLQVIGLEPVAQSSGKIVYQQLCAAQAATGVPRAILADGGSDLKTGIEQYVAEHSDQTVGLYDIKHKTAAVLKAELKRDARWEAFLAEMGRARTAIVQTPLAFLLSPTLKLKARYMNLAEVVRWGAEMLKLFERLPADLPVSRQQLEEKFGWLHSYAAALEEWRAMLEVVEAFNRQIRDQGYHAGASSELQQLLAGAPSAPGADRMRATLLAFVAAQSAAARPDEHLLGTTEVLESLIGTGKRLERQQSKHGFTKLVLGLAAAVVRPTREFVQTALETTKTQDVLDWSRKNLGPSLQALRRKAFPKPPPAAGEQKGNGIKRRPSPIPTF